MGRRLKKDEIRWIEGPSEAKEPRRSFDPDPVSSCCWDTEACVGKDREAGLPCAWGRGSRWEAQEGFDFREAMGSHRRLWGERVPGPQMLTLNARF